MRNTQKWSGRLDLVSYSNKGKKEHVRLGGVEQKEDNVTESHEKLRSVEKVGQKQT